MDLRNEIKQILTPPEPAEAHVRGGVVNWEAHWTKEGLGFILDRIMGVIKKAQSEVEPQ